MIYHIKQIPLGAFACIHNSVITVCLDPRSDGVVMKIPDNEFWVHEDGTYNIKSYNPYDERTSVFNDQALSMMYQHYCPYYFFHFDSFESLDYHLYNLNKVPGIGTIYTYRNYEDFYDGCCPMVTDKEIGMQYKLLGKIDF